MNIQTGSLVERQVGQWQVERTSAERNEARSVELAPLLTVSRLLGCGGRELAHWVAQSTGLPLYDGELVDEIVRRSHAPRALVAEVDEHAPGRVGHWLEGVLAQDFFDANDYRRYLTAVMKSIAAAGSAVILGRGANLVPHPQPQLDVRVVAPLEMRISMLVRRLGISPEQAVLTIRRSDQERRAFTRRVHHADWNDARRYDLVINTGRISMEDAVALIETSWNRLMLKIQ